MDEGAESRMRADIYAWSIHTANEANTPRLDAEGVHDLGRTLIQRVVDPEGQRGQRVLDPLIGRGRGGRSGERPTSPHRCEATRRPNMLN